MTLIAASNLTDAYVSFRTAFFMYLAKASPLYQRLATIVPSSAPTEDYKWLGDIPTMKKWVGQREIGKLTGEKFTISNDDWANGIEVDRDDLRDDRLGLVMPRIQGLAQAAVAKMDARVVDHYVNGFDATEGTCYDGQFLFDTDHTADGGGTGTSQDNVTNELLDEAAIDTGIQSMMGRIDSSGEPLNLFPDVLLCGPALRKNAKELTQQKIKATGEENVDAGLLELIVHPRITGNKWFLIDTKQAIKPVILQVRQEPEFRAPVKSLDDFQAFMSKSFFFGADCTFGVGYAAWQTAYGSDATE